MRVKISEKKLAAGIICLILGVILLLNTTLFLAPVKISEFGILSCILSLALIAFGTIVLRTARIRV